MFLLFVITLQFPSQELSGVPEQIVKIFTNADGHFVLSESGFTHWELDGSLALKYDDGRFVDSVCKTNEGYAISWRIQGQKTRGLDILDPGGDILFSKTGYFTSYFLRSGNNFFVSPSQFRQGAELLIPAIISSESIARKSRALPFSPKLLDENFKSVFMSLDAGNMLLMSPLEPIIYIMKDGVAKRRVLLEIPDFEPYKGRYTGGNVRNWFLEFSRIVYFGPV